MNRNFILILIIAGVAVLTYGVFAWQSGYDQSNTQSKNSNTTRAAFSVTNTSNNTTKTVKSTEYQFSQSVPADFRITTESSRSTAGSALGTVVFARENPNTSETPNRETPNGFNTAEDDTWVLSIYQNDAYLTTSDTSTLQLWITENISNDIKGDPVKITTLDYTITRFTLADGIQSYGYYYFLVQPEWVYVFGTGDLTDSQMRGFLQTFSIDS